MTGPTRSGALTVLLAISIFSAAGTSNYMEGDVRLRGADYTALQGRVEVFHEGAWLSICDESWDTRIGDVVCRQLGFSGGAMSTDRSALFGQGTSASWLTGITCSGLENTLSDCTNLTYGTSMCSHANDAGVRCTYPMYEGCYSMSPTGPLTAYTIPSDNIDISRCLEICREVHGGYTYAGVQQGRTCTCGNAIVNSVSQGNSGCNTVCAGDGTEICGGNAEVSVYRTDDYNEPARYILSPNFPNPYADGDAFTRTVSIPYGSDYAVVSFSFFKLSPGDSVMLQAAGRQPGQYPGPSDGTLPSSWISGSATSTFKVTFSVDGGSPGDTGFVIEYEFGNLCHRDALPNALAQGSITANQESYLYQDKVYVTCNAGYQWDRDGFVCQLDGTWSQAPMCSLIPTTQPPPPTTDTASTAAPGATDGSDETTPSGDDSSTLSGMESPPSAVTAVSPMATSGVPCAIPQVAEGTVDSGGRSQVSAGDTVTLTCNDAFVPEDGNDTATCLANGEFNVTLACAPPPAGTPVWLISIIVVAAVLAIIVVVLIILVVLVSRGPKMEESRGRTPPPPEVEVYNAHEGASSDRLVAIAPSVQQNPSAPSSVISGSDDGGTVNQGAQTDADPGLGDLGDPMVGDSDVNHPTRDYPGAGAGRPATISTAPLRPAPVSPPPPQQQPVRPRPLDYRPNSDFSMLASEEMLAVRALDNVVSDFERGDRDLGYFLGPTSPAPYGMDPRSSRYGSRPVRFSQRSRHSNFYGLY